MPKNLWEDWGSIRKQGAVKLIAQITIFWSLGWGGLFTLFIFIIEPEALSKKFFFHLSYISVLWGLLLSIFIWIRFEQRFRKLQKPSIALKTSHERPWYTERGLLVSHIERGRLGIECFGEPSNGKMPYQIVYHGPAVAGKTTNLLYLHQHVTCERKGELRCIAHPQYEPRHLFFEIRLSEAITQNVSQVCLQCIPGCTFYEEFREDLIQQADAIVFVADSQYERFEANDDMLTMMRRILQQRGYSLQEFPCILQYNKRDLPNIASIEELQYRLNPVNVPHFETVASQGIGVLESFQEIVHRLALSKQVPIV